MKKLQANIIAGMYSYFSKQFNIITECTSNKWEVIVNVEVGGVLSDFIKVSSHDWTNEDRLEDFESAISDTVEQLKAKHILNQHNRLEVIEAE